MPFRGASLAVAILTFAVAGCGKWGDRLACGEDDCFFTEAEWARVASLANITRTPPPRDPSNERLPTDDQWLQAHAPGGGAGTLAALPVVKLGWLLYHEPLLSGGRYDKDVLGRDAPSPRAATCGSMALSCATCHDPRRYGSDFTSVPRNVSNGAGFYDVNIQQTLNAARFDILYWNGRADALWAQAAQVIESAVSMNGDRLNTIRVLRDRYPAEYAAAFPAAADALGAAAGLPDHGKPTAKAYDDLSDTTKATVNRIYTNAAKAIGAYEWFLSSDGSPFDRFVSAGPSSELLAPAAKRGLKLFVGRAGCIDCHRTPLLSDGRFHNIGVPQTGERVPTVAECNNDKCGCSPVTASTCLPSGAYAGLQKLKAQAFSRCKTHGPCFADGAPGDAMLGAWRTPSLRDVAMTAPYMHDGVYATLADVVWHYDQGGATAVLGKSELAPLLLSDRDRDDLVAFLEALTGEPGPAELVTPPGAASAADGGVDGPAATSADGGADGGPLCP